MMFHALNVIQVNAYVIYKSFYNKDHKVFLEAFIKSLADQAKADEYASTTSHLMKPLPQSIRKKRHMSMKRPSLPECPLSGNPSEHQERVGLGVKQQTCIYCSYLHAMAVQNNETDLPKLSKVHRVCTYCDVHLCKSHFQIYHS